MTSFNKVLCGLIALSCVSVQAEISYLKNKKLLCASIVAAAAYYTFKTEPKRQCDYSLEALTNHPTQWVEDIVGNKGLNAVIESQTDDGRIVIKNGYEARGFGVILDKWETVAAIIGIFALLDDGHEKLSACLASIFGEAPGSSLAI